MAQVGPESIFHIIYMSLLKISVQNISGLTISSQMSDVTNLAGVCYIHMVRPQFFSPASLLVVAIVSEYSISLDVSRISSWNHLSDEQDS